MRGGAEDILRVHVVYSPREVVDVLAGCGIRPKPGVTPYLN